MGKVLIKGSLVGGFILFIWMMISWMILPWHCSNIHTFKNEEQVAQVIKENARTDGIYLLPNLCDSQANKESRTEHLKKGPFVFASIKRYGFDLENIAPYIVGFVVQFVGAFFITFLLLRAKDPRYWSRVLFVTVIGIIVGILGAFPNWNWWGFPFCYAGVEFLDQVIGWFLAGLALAAFCKPKPSTQST